MTNHSNLFKGLEMMVLLLSNKRQDIGWTEINDSIWAEEPSSIISPL